ncbi:MAG: TRAM domain-containing protein [Faecalibacterium sp.]|nr:TRAM domain-containing protein [Faecalibacterium sp.]
MSVSKNQIIPLQIESLSSDGSGIGHYEGQAIFVPGTAPGDVMEAKIVKDCGRYAFGIVHQLLTPSPARLKPDCPCA